MKEGSSNCCSVCGEEKAPGQVWFLLAEDHAGGCVRILQWKEGLALRPGIFCACSPEHAEELVIHWMTTGSLDFPFAVRAEEIEWPRRFPSSTLPWVTEPDTRGAQQIAELAVDRESIARLLNENGEFLQIILDELVLALQHATQQPSRRCESGGESHLSMLRHV